MLQKCMEPFLGVDEDAVAGRLDAFHGTEKNTKIASAGCLHEIPIAFSPCTERTRDIHSIMEYGTRLHAAAALGISEDALPASQNVSPQHSGC